MFDTAATELASRQIMWNVSDPANTILMYIVMTISLVVMGVGLYRHAELWLSGQRDDFGQVSIFERVWHLFSYGFMQKKISEDRKIGLAHVLIYFGFLVLLFTTTMVMLDHDFGIKIYRGQFYLFLTAFSDIFGLGVLVGCLVAYHRRYVASPDKLHSAASDSFILNILTLLIVQGFILEALRIHVTDDPWALYSPVGYILSQAFWGLSDQAASSIHFITWWFHTITVFVGIALVPYTKLFHIFASSVNIFFQKRSRPKGALSNPGDLTEMIEKGDEFSIGLKTIKDYTWKQLLELDACTSCGRCQEVCPAYMSGAPLSPKWLILDTRNHALGLHANDKITHSRLAKTVREFDSALVKKFTLLDSGLSQEADTNLRSAGSYRGENTGVQNSCIAIAASVDQQIAGEVIERDAFWSCTTCRACVEVCPVGIDHVEQIIGNRRYLTSMEGSLPQEAQKTLRAIESRGNPYGAAETRSDWFAELDLPILKGGDSVDYLYWVGCISAFDQRKQNIAKATVKILRTAGASFGVLGNAEGCTGDPARRLGDENLFQQQAKSNIEILKSIKFKTLVANCTHCFNTIRNEYPQFGKLSDNTDVEIIHHSVLIRRFINKGLISLKPESTGVTSSITFHDPCYLGRYNNEYDAPRELITLTAGAKPIEMRMNKESGLCCGAGGGHFWMDLKLNKKERINVIRADQALATGATTIATACPFCMHMLEDGLKLSTNPAAESVHVADIAELVATRL